MEYDAHVKARKRLAHQIIRRRLEWGLFVRKGKSFLTVAELLPLAYAALAIHKWSRDWGAKYSQYQMFGAPQKIIGTFKDVPAHEIHQIMCKMKV